MTVYFDNAATTMPCDEAVRAVAEAMTVYFANPSSGHGPGREAAEKLREARESVAFALGARPEEVYFTSGGTEADNWALRAAAFAGRHRGRHIITSGAEHDAVRQTARALEAEGCEVTFLRPDKNGRVTAEAVSEALREDTVLVSLMLVNNETGAVSPIREISELLRERGSRALLHTDAVQGFLKVPFTPKSLGADLITVSAHKIHGPKGAGALYIRSGLRLTGLMRGGGQEGGLRPGTEALPAIMGFGAAARAGKARMEENIAHMRDIREYTVSRIRETLPEAVVIGEGDAPHIAGISLPGFGSEVIMNWLDGAGICVSKSSACKKGARSHVLEAMGLPPDVIDGALRLSFSRYNTRAEADYFIKTLAEAAGSIRKRGNKR